jgi:hypothetical protein
VSPSLSATLVRWASSDTWTIGQPIKRGPILAIFAALPPYREDDVTEEAEKTSADIRDKKVKHCVLKCHCTPAG